MRPSDAVLTQGASGHCITSIANFDKRSSPFANINGQMVLCKFLLFKGRHFNGLLGRKVASTTLEGMKNPMY